MSSLNSALSTARTAIFAHQTAVQVASHNVANAQTEGYSRQRVSLSASYPHRTPVGVVGTGVSVDTIRRVRDEVTDQSVRRESGRAAGYQVRQEVLGQVERVFGEPSDTGLAATLDAFWASWSDLANAPGSTTARVMVRQRAQQTVGAFQHTAERLNEISDSVRVRIGASVDQINGLAKRIADLNREIVRVEVGGTQEAGDLRDLRDRMLDDLSKLASVRVTDRTGGGVAVSVDGAPLIDGEAYHTLSTETTGGVVSVRLGSRALTPPAEGSALGELLNLVNNEIPGVRGELDELARGVVLRVNELHTEGWTPSAAGVNFFAQPADPTQITARNMAVSNEVLADVSVIAARRENSGSDNDLALNLAGLRQAASMPPPPAEGSRTFGEAYRGLVTGVALKVQTADNSHTVYATLASQAETRRASISGVSTDEELIRLIQHQQAYTAATRLVSTVDEMMQSLISMI